VSNDAIAAFVPPPREPNPASFAFQIALTQRMNALHPDALMPATRSSDIARANRLGRIASFVSIENGAAIENRLDTLSTFYDLGVRLCDSATEAPRHAGLADFGKEVIAEMNRLGMLVDLSHGGVRPQWVYSELVPSDDASLGSRTWIRADRHGDHCPDPGERETLEGISTQKSSVNRFAEKLWFHPSQKRSAET
jgi:Membrane dipeptidase (Peptidase family M19)